MQQRMPQSPSGSSPSSLVDRSGWLRSATTIFGDVFVHAALFAAVFGASIGLVIVAVGAPDSRQKPSHSEGACMALDMATAYGFLDQTKRRVVTRALSDATNPYVAHFPGGHKALEAACASVSENRWPKS